MEMWECERSFNTNDKANHICEGRQSEGEAAKDYKVEVMVGMSVSGMFTPSE